MVNLFFIISIPSRCFRFSGKTKCLALSASISIPSPNRAAGLSKVKRPFPPSNKDHSGNPLSIIPLTRLIKFPPASITSQKSEISDLKSTVARQQKEIEALKASQVGAKQKSSEPQQKWITTENLLLAVKRECDDVILKHYEQLPTMFADRQDFDDFRKSAEQKFLSAHTFNDYKKSLETRLKSIEGKLTHRYALLTINLHHKNGSSESKNYFNLDSIISAFKNGNLQWLKSIITCLSIGLLALHLLHSITP